MLYFSTRNRTGSSRRGRCYREVTRVSADNFTHRSSCRRQFHVTAVTVKGRLVKYDFDIRIGDAPGTSMDRHSANTKMSVRAVIAGLFFCAVAVLFLYSELSETARSQTRRRPAVRRLVQPPKYSNFPHDIKAHQLDCSSCHKFPSENWNKVRRL